MTVRESGRDAVMINCNPETVSTDYDTSDRLYFEPLTVEDVLAVIEVEQPEGVIVQFGGQTPLRLARALGGGGRDAPRDARGRDRPRRGPRPLRRASSAPGDPPPQLRHRVLGRGGTGGRGGRGIPAPGAPLVRPGRQGDGDLLLVGWPERLPRGERQGRPEASAPPRPLPRRRDRGGRRRALRRHRGLGRRDHAARRGGRRPLRATRLASCRR